MDEPLGIRVCASVDVDHERIRIFFKSPAQPVGKSVIFFAESETAAQLGNAFPALENAETGDGRGKKSGELHAELRDDQLKTAYFVEDGKGVVFRLLKQTHRFRTEDLVVAQRGIERTVEEAQGGKPFDSGRCGGREQIIAEEDAVGRENAFGHKTARLRELISERTADQSRFAAAGGAA